MSLLKRSLYSSWVIQFDKIQYLENRIKLPVYVPGVLYSSNEILKLSF